MNYKVWHGNIEKYIDTIVIEEFKDILTGCYGGCSESGAQQNEDGYLLLKPTDDSTLTILFDSHTTNSSVIYLIHKITAEIDKITQICKEPVSIAIPKLQSFFCSFMVSEQVKTDCKKLTGETAMLICFQKQEYLWWLSVGDNSLYVFHKDYNELGQHKINTRIFFQWIGQQNSLALDVPCYSLGTLQLREGDNKIVLLTDGILEIESRPFENSTLLENIFANNNLHKSTSIILNEVKTKKGRDNATMVSWQVNCSHKPLNPSRL